MKEIDCYKDLVEMNSTDDYKLTDDIDASDSKLLKSGFDPIYRFAGTIDGNGYSIQNLRVVTDYKFNGFIFNNSGEIRDLELVDCEFSGYEESDCFGESYGCMVGVNEGVIKDCRVTDCTISADRVVGGFVGKNYGNIVDCGVSGCTISGDHDIAGFVGINLEGNIMNSFVKDCNLSGDSRLGGFVVENDVTTVEYFNKENLSVIDSCFVKDIEISCTDVVSGFAVFNKSALKFCYTDYVIPVDCNGSGLLYYAEQDLDEVRGCSCQDSLYSAVPRKDVGVEEISIKERLIMEFDKLFDEF